MKKRKKGRKLNREKDQRKALLKSLALSFFLKGKIKTTEAKAKELKIYAEKLITRSRKADLASKRYLAKFFPKSVVKKMTEEIGPSYKDKKGGYTRIIKLGPRKTDGAKMAIIEMIKP